MSGSKTIVMAGAGLAGLSLAVHLVERGVRRPIVLVDPRSNYDESDRTWCFWRHEDSPFDGCISHRWTRWSVSAGGRRAVSASSRHPYQCVTARDLYDHALHRLERASNVRFELDTSVTDVIESANGCEVQTDRGTLDADLVFDSRPPAPPSSGLVQSFAGIHLRTEAVFDPGEVQLMHFHGGSERDRVRFLYVLPFSETEALVESTAMEPVGRGTTREEFLRDVSAFLSDVHGVRGFEALGHESGRIPMVAGQSDGVVGRHVRIGTGGGMVRPSTGYAFQTIQARSARIADQVLAGSDSVAVPEFSPRTAWFDRVFLRYLERNLATAPAIFLSMFEGTRGDQQARFLSDRGSLTDELAIMLTIPKRDFALQALRDVFDGDRAA